MGVALAVASALGYGMSDFVAGMLSRRAAAIAVAAFAQLFATLTVVAVAPFFPAQGGSAAALAWGAISGIGSGLGTAFLYRGLGAGRMSVVAPVSAVGAAVLPVFVGVGLGERPSLVAGGGIAVAVPAIWLVSRSDDADPQSGPVRRIPVAAGVIDGLIAGGGFALLFVALDQVPAGTGLWPVAAGHVVSIGAVACLALPGRVALRLPARGLGGSAIVGGLGAAGTVLYMYATRGQLLAVVAVLASLYPAITIALARTVLRERISAGQVAGLAGAALAVSLITLG